LINVLQDLLTKGEIKTLIRDQSAALGSKLPQLGTTRSLSAFSCSLFCFFLLFRASPTAKIIASAAAGAVGPATGATAGKDDGLVT